jgi:hypothetical protein
MEVPGAVLDMGYFLDKYTEELVSFGLGIAYGTPHGRRMVHELAKAAVVYRADQAKIIGRFAYASAGARVGALRTAGTFVAMGAARGALALAKHPATLVVAGGVVGGHLVGSTHVVKTRGDPNPLLMGVF